MYDLLVNTRRQRINPSHPNPGQTKKINSNFHLHTSLWCLKRFYEGLNHLTHSAREYFEKLALQIGITTPNFKHFYLKN